MLPLDCFPQNYLSPSPAHGVPGSLFTWDKYSSFVWNASILLADKIAAKEIEVEGKRVLELGAGLGLPGLVAAHVGADLVVLTDYDEPAALDDTARAVDEALPVALQRKVHVVPHTWGPRIDSLLSLAPSYDLVLVAECVWSPSLHASLVDSLRALLSASPHATVCFSAGFHSGRKHVASFLAAAADAHIVPVNEKDWVELSVDGAARAWEWRRVELARAAKVSVALEEEDRQEERNRWTLFGTLCLQSESA
ncbi:hypothetical protein JCM3775_000475 [Rhodotorula graminis]